MFTHGRDPASPIVKKAFIRTSTAFPEVLESETSVHKRILTSAEWSGDDERVADALQGLYSLRRSSGRPPLAPLSLNRRPESTSGSDSESEDSESESDPQHQSWLSGPLMTTHELLTLSKGWTRSSGAQNPALKYLTWTKNTKEKGWLRNAEAVKADRNVPMTVKKKPGHLSTTEKQLVLSLKQTLDPAGDTVAAVIASAWGVNSRTVRGIQNKDGLAVPRKVRCDKGTTLFNSDAKCKQVYTPLYVFKKTMRNCGEEVTDKELNDRWAAASPATKEDAKQKALQLLLRGPHLAEEITQAMQQTQGRIPWRALTAHLAGGASEIAPFCLGTVQKLVLSLPNSEYTKPYVRSP
jgi:hypothetical protein